MTAEVADKSHSCTCSDRNKGSDASPGADNELFDRKKLLEVTSSIIRDTYDRISGDRFRLRDGDKERLQYIRALTGLIALHGALLEKARAPDLSAYEAKEQEDFLDRIIRGYWGTPIFHSMYSYTLMRTISPPPCSPRPSM